MNPEERNQKNDKTEMKQLEEIINTIIKKIEIAKIPEKDFEDDDFDDFEDDDFFDEDYDSDGEQYDADFLCDLLYDVFEMVQGNVPSCYTGADVTTGMLGLIALHNKSTVKVLTSLLVQLQMLQTQLMENDREKIELLKKQNELLEKLLNK